MSDERPDPDDGAGTTQPESDGEIGDDGDADAPLSDLAGRVSERRAERRRREDGRSDDGGRSVAADADGSDGDPFESMSVAEIDEDALWSALEDPDDPTSRVGGEAAEPVGSAAASAPDASEHVVDKAEYCQRCPHLADPPELACTHEGTRIVEVVDAERFRVRNCPMVEE